MNATSTETRCGYLNLHLWTDIHPYEIVRWVSDETVDVRLMDAIRDVTWSPDFVPGGFCGHLRNNSDQRWTFTSNPDNPIVRVRLGKKGWKSNLGRHVLADSPRKFHDYNF